MNDLEKEIKGATAFKLACDANRLLSLAEEDDLRLVKLSDAKRLVYVEEELQDRKNKLLPGLPKPEPSPQTKEPEGANYMNVILGSYHKRKSEPKKYTHAFDVRGHFRYLQAKRYKVKQTIWIPPYVKGDGVYIPKTYNFVINEVKK